jgi:hypothetical protein
MTPTDYYTFFIVGFFLIMIGYDIIFNQDSKGAGLILFGGFTVVGMIALVL